MNPRRFAAVLLLALVACGSPPANGTPTPTPTPTPEPTPDLVSCPSTIVIEDFTYSAPNCQVAVGTTITFVNRDSQPHTATAEQDAAAPFDTGTLEQDQSAEVTFTEPGDYPYYCAVHPDMAASITVR